MRDYACCIVDLDKGKVIEFLKSRKKEDIEAFFKEKGELICQQIEVVSSDLWEGYTNLAGDLFPNAESVVDRFHFFMGFSKVLDSYRRKLRKNFPYQKAFKRLRWALLKSKEDLKEEEIFILKKAFRLDENLAKIYQLRQDLKGIFDQKIDRQKANTLIERWKESALSLGIGCVNLFVNTLIRWKDKVLNFFNLRITNGIVEGLNNGIRGIIRRSFGVKNFDYLRSRVLIELG
jgi:transposase